MEKQKTFDVRMWKFVKFRKFYEMTSVVIGSTKICKFRDSRMIYFVDVAFEFFRKKFWHQDDEAMTKSWSEIWKLFLNNPEQMNHCVIWKMKSRSRSQWPECPKKPRCQGWHRHRYSLHPWHQFVIIIHFCLCSFFVWWRRSDQLPIKLPSMQCYQIDYLCILAFSTTSSLI